LYEFHIGGIIIIIISQKFDLTIPNSMPCEKVSFVFYSILSYFSISGVIFIISITYEVNSLDRVFITEEIHFGYPFALAVGMSYTQKF
jgi:hypothetical protein